MTLLISEISLYIQLQDAYKNTDYLLKHEKAYNLMSNLFQKGYHQNKFNDI